MVLFSYLPASQQTAIQVISIGNFSFTSKIGHRKLAGALDRCFVLFENLQQCTPNVAWWEPNSQPNRLENNVSNYSATGARSRLGSSTSPINDGAPIILFQ